MAFITAAQLEDAVLVRLGKAATDTPATSMTAVITDAVEDAYQEIVTTLLERGYTTAQIAGWDRGEEFNRKIGVCLALTNIGINHEIDEQRLDRVCKCREELQTVSIIVDGALIEPSTDGADIGHGDMDDTNDTFIRDEMVF